MLLNSNNFYKLCALRIRHTDKKAKLNTFFQIIHRFNIFPDCNVCMQNMMTHLSDSLVLTTNIVFVIKNHISRFTSALKCTTHIQSQAKKNNTPLKRDIYKSV